MIDALPTCYRQWLGNDSNNDFFCSASHRTCSGLVTSRAMISNESDVYRFESRPRIRCYILRRYFNKCGRNSFLNVCRISLHNRNSITDDVCPQVSRSRYSIRHVGPMTQNQTAARSNNPDSSTSCHIIIPRLSLPETRPNVATDRSGLHYTRHTMNW